MLSTDIFMTDRHAIPSSSHSTLPYDAFCKPSRRKSVVVDSDFSFATVDIRKIFRLNTECRTSKYGENVSFHKHIAVPCPPFEKKTGFALVTKPIDLLFCINRMNYSLA